MNRDQQISHLMKECNMTKANAETAAKRLRREENHHAQDALRFIAYGVVPCEGDFNPRAH